MPDRYIIIIGAMKAGTTTLFRLLRQHPRIAYASYKEPGYFAFPEVHARGRDWYHSLFDFDPDRHLWRMEASTDYTKYPFASGVWERMKATPDAEFRLIYIMRDPLRRMESHAQHVQWAGKELGQQNSPRADHGLDAGLSPLSLAVSQYDMQLDQYAEAWTAGCLHLVTLDGLKTDPDTELARLWHFLDLDMPDQAPTLPHANSGAEKRIPDPRWEALASRRGLTRLGRLVLPKRLREAIKSRFARQLRVEGRFRFTAEEKTTLAAALSPGVVRLRDHWGVAIPEAWDTRLTERDDGGRD